MDLDSLKARPRLGQWFHLLFESFNKKKKKRLNVLFSKERQKSNAQKSQTLRESSPLFLLVPWSILPAIPQVFRYKKKEKSKVFWDHFTHTKLQISNDRNLVFSATVRTTHIPQSPSAFPLHFFRTHVCTLEEASSEWMYGCVVFKRKDECLHHKY